MAPSWTEVTCERYDVPLREVIKRTTLKVTTAAATAAMIASRARRERTCDPFVSPSGPFCWSADAPPARR